ncbi:exported hypothetical protein [Mesorhizobium sp. STM 4661]|nr:exported hypothetical protein [Mesorhizobium sp. STM 4661]
MAGKGRGRCGYSLATAIFCFLCVRTAVADSPRVPDGAGPGPEPVQCTKCDQDYEVAKRKCSAKAEEDARKACVVSASIYAGGCRRTCQMGTIYNTPQ